MHRLAVAEAARSHPTTLIARPLKATLPLDSDGAECELSTEAVCITVLQRCGRGLLDRRDRFRPSTATAPSRVATEAYLDSNIAEHWGRVLMTAEPSPADPLEGEDNDHAAGCGGPDVDDMSLDVLDQIFVGPLVHSWIDVCHHSGPQRLCRELEQRCGLPSDGVGGSWALIAQMSDLVTRAKGTRFQWDAGHVSRSDEDLVLDALRSCSSDGVVWNDALESSWRIVLSQLSKQPTRM